ncbi:hypothetical protein HYH02_000710 [Chlamydomonas schloesseri]|uniref:Uncharacterized protein n=1 Tax=Chlamydomonas schloesseri TaxID=2026947 RepID=A0A835WWS8_9CHLO|nr:hypothetical protein HYH02_000710 [Chlamydomonas schloesseri]|eukprot:KAG2454879.1 hypothetical protein HYH02_000710 [Chlamydomonas schloesseri]
MPSLNCAAKPGFTALADTDFIFTGVGFGATAGLYQTTAALAETNCSTNVNCTGFIVADDGRGWYLSAGRILQYSRSIGMCTYIKSGMSWGNAACTCQDTYPANNPTGEVLTYSGCTGAAIGTYIPDRPCPTPPSPAPPSPRLANCAAKPGFTALADTDFIFTGVGFGATAGLYQTTAALAETSCSTNVNCTGFIVADDGRGWYLSAGRILQYSRSIGMCTYVKSGMSWGNAACACQDTYPANNPTGEVLTYSGCTGAAIGTYIPDRPCPTPPSPAPPSPRLANCAAKPGFTALADTDFIFTGVGFGATAGLYQTTAALAETNCSTNVNCTGFIVADDGRGWYLSAGRILQYSRSIGMCTYIKSGMSWGNAACTCQDTYPANNPTGEVLTYSGCTGVAIGTYIPDRPCPTPPSPAPPSPRLANCAAKPGFTALADTDFIFTGVGFGATAGLYQTTAALAETNCSTNVNCTGFIVADDGRGWYLSAGRILQYSRSIGMCTYIKSGMSWGNAACTCQDTYPANNPTGEVLTYSGCTGVAIGTYIPDRPCPTPPSPAPPSPRLANCAAKPGFTALADTDFIFTGVGFGATAGLYQTTAALAETNCSTNVNCTGFIVADDGRGWYLSAGRILQYSRSIGMCTYIKSGMSWGNAACTCQDTYPANNPTGEVLTYSGCTGAAIGTYIPDRPCPTPPSPAPPSPRLANCAAKPGFTALADTDFIFTGVGFGATAGLYQTTAGLAETNCSTNVNCTGFIVADNGRGWYLSAGRILQYSRSIGMCTYIKSGMSWGNAACTCQDTYPANNPTGEVLTYSGCTGVAIGTYIPDRPCPTPPSPAPPSPRLANCAAKPGFTALADTDFIFTGVGFGATAGLYQTTAALAETNCSTNVNCTGFIVADDGRGWYLSAGRILQYSRSIGMCTYIKSGMSWGNAACTCQDTYPANNPTGEVLTYSGCTGVAIGTYIPDRPWCAPVVQGSCLAEFTVMVNNVTVPGIFCTYGPSIAARPPSPPSPPSYTGVARDSAPSASAAASTQDLPAADQPQELPLLESSHVSNNTAPPPGAAAAAGPAVASGTTSIDGTAIMASGTSSSTQRGAVPVSTVVGAAIGGVIGVAVLALAVVGTTRWRRQVLQDNVRVIPTVGII